MNYALGDGVLITGGHLPVIHDEESVNEGTVKSFEAAARIYAAGRDMYKNLGLGIFVNDIGATCTATSCSIKGSASIEEFELPAPYDNILHRLGVCRSDLRIISEKFTRNRGKRILKKEIKRGNPNILLRDEGYFFVCDDKSIDIQLTRINENDEVGTPACPLIMCAYSLEHIREGFKSSLNFYYAGEDNYENIPNYYVIEHGYKIAQALDGTADVKNIYIFEDAVLKNFDLTSWGSLP